jgi:2-isopropylmalate synthase
MNKAALSKYQPFAQVNLPDRTWPDQTIVHAPIWASVDLRDGNQALPIPMSIQEKLEYFDMLVRVGFKQIEVGFPSASDTEFHFVRRLIEENRVPDDVTIQILVQARENLIARSYESLVGAKNAIIHLYNPTSTLQRRVTFGNASKDDVKKIAIQGAIWVADYATKYPQTNWTFQYSPESFSDTELDFSLNVCHSVMDIWKPTTEKKIILNLPNTVEWFMPNVHADQIEWFCRNIRDRDSVIISLHTHNDRGTGTAATELGLLAGADRVEGTLFGNGERTGNLDIVTVALNMNSQGIVTGLDFSDLVSIREIYERCNRLVVPERQPYAGELVFTAFSGSHQDAIKKGFDLRAKEDSPRWQIPYLTIDPQDIGRSYEAIIRINSQSGKGGVAYILDREFGYDLPKTMHPQVGKYIYDRADFSGRELLSSEIRQAFFEEFVNVKSPLSLVDYRLTHDISERGIIHCFADVIHDGVEMKINGAGNGPINAFVHALDKAGLKDFTVKDYRSHAIRSGSDASAAAYVQIQSNEDRLFWGAGEHHSIEMSGLLALVSAWNLLHSR